MRLAAAAAAALAFAAAAQTIAVIDSERIFDSLGEVADATELLQTEMEEWQAHADSLQEEIDAIEADLSYTMVMSPERRLEREDLLEEKTEELQAYLAETFGPGGLVESRNEELVAPIVAEINETVQQICLDEDIDLVIDTAAGNVVYAEGSLDITDMVLEEMSTSGGS